MSNVLSADRSSNAFEKKAQFGALLIFLSVNSRQPAPLEVGRAHRALAGLRGGRRRVAPEGFSVAAIPETGAAMDARLLRFRRCQT